LLSQAPFLLGPESGLEGWILLISGQNWGWARFANLKGKSEVVGLYPLWGISPAKQKIDKEGLTPYNTTRIWGGKIHPERRGDNGNENGSGEKGL